VATNVVQSLRKGEPVVVTGKLRTQEWVNPEGAHTTLVIEATALGHDLVFGTTRLERTLGPGAHASSDALAAAVDVSALPEVPDGEDADDEADEPDDELDEDDLDEAADLDEEHLDEALVG
jgi:single-strand DNA-binding protein